MAFFIQTKIIIKYSISGLEFASKIKNFAQPWMWQLH